MAYALAFDSLHVKRTIMIRPTYVAYWPIPGTVAVTIALTKEGQHPTGMGLQKI